MVKETVLQLGEDETASLESYLFNRHLRPRVEPPMNETLLGKTTHVLASDGYPLAASIFDPRPKNAKNAPLVVIASATGVRREYYASFASWLATARGMRVITFDYRGIGGSRPERINRFEASLIDWVELDLTSVIRWATTEFGGGEQQRNTTSIVGHSVGGQLLGLLPEESKKRIRSIVLVGSQSGDFRLWPTIADRARYGALWYAVVPSVVSTLGYLPGAFGIGEDLPGGVASEWAKWCRTPGYMVGGEEGSARRDGYRMLTAPIYAFGFDDDDYAPPAAVSALLALYEGSRVTRRQVAKAEAKVGHFGFFRERFKSTFWQEAASFLEGGTPS